MKKSILILFASLIYISSMAQKMVIPTATTANKQVITDLVYSDGWKGKLEGSNTKARRDSLWIANHPEYKNPVFLPPAGQYALLNIKNNSEINLIKSNFIKIKPGIYNNISLKNQDGIKDVVIDASGAIFDNGAIDFIKGDNISIYGLEIRNNPGRAIKFNFSVNNFKLYNLKLLNCGDVAISSENPKEYDGTAATINKGFKLINCVFDNSSAVGLTGNFDKNLKQDLGRFENPEIAYNTFKNSRNTGKVFWAANVSGYDVHNNTVDNLNQDNNNHNGIFEMQGSGKFHDNKLTNYQGNSIRAWLFSWGDKPATLEIYNNICYNTRKYSGFEIQEFERNIWPGKSTFANAKVYNNTVGSMALSHDWEGQVLDLYNITGSLDYYNNLGFDLYRPGLPTTNMINGNGKALGGFRDSGNVYIQLKDEAINPNFSSKIKGIGAN